MPGSAWLVPLCVYCGQWSSLFKSLFKKMGRVGSKILQPKKSVFLNFQYVLTHFCVGGSTHDHENSIKMIGRWFCIVWVMNLKKSWNRPKKSQSYHYQWSWKKFVKNDFFWSRWGRKFFFYFSFKAPTKVFKISHSKKTFLEKKFYLKIAVSALTIT